MAKKKARKAYSQKDVILAGQKKQAWSAVLGGALGAGLCSVIAVASFPAAPALALGFGVAALGAIAVTYGYGKKLWNMSRDKKKSAANHEQLSDIEGGGPNLSAGSRIEMGDLFTKVYNTGHVTAIEGDDTMRSAKASALI